MPGPCTNTTTAIRGADASPHPFNPHGLSKPTEERFTPVTRIETPSFRPSIFIRKKDSNIDPSFFLSQPPRAPPDVKPPWIAITFKS